MNLKEKTDMLWPIMRSIADHTDEPIAAREAAFKRIAEQMVHLREVMRSREPKAKK